MYSCRNKTPPRTLNNHKHNINHRSFVVEMSSRRPLSCAYDIDKSSEIQIDCVVTAARWTFYRAYSFYLCVSLNVLLWPFSTLFRSFCAFGAFCCFCALRGITLRAQSPPYRLIWNVICHFAIFKRFIICHLSAFTVHHFSLFTAQAVKAPFAKMIRDFFVTDKNFHKYAIK